MPIGSPRQNGGKGVGGSGGGFALGPEQNEFADATARNSYATANAAWLALYNADRANWIEVGVDIQRRNAAGNAWEDVSGIIRGSEGLPGKQGVYYEEIALNSATVPSAAPVGGSIPSIGGAVVPPSGGWVTLANLTVPGMGENTFGSSTRVDPAKDMFPLVPIWSFPTEVGNPAGAQAAQVAAEASATKATAGLAFVSTARIAAEAAQAAAETAKADAETAKTDAETAKTDAETAQAAAKGHEDAAETAQAGAETAQTNAETAQSGAETAQAAAVAAATTAQAGSDGTVLFGGDDPPAIALGSNDDSYWTIAAPNKAYKKIAGSWVLQFTVTGGAAPTPVQTHKNFVGTTTSALSAVTAADFTVSGISEALTIPTYTGRERLLFARPASESDPTGIYLYQVGRINSINQIGIFVKGSSQIQLGSIAHNWWGTGGLQLGFGGYILEQVN